MSAVPSADRPDRLRGPVEADATQQLYERHASRIFRYCFNRLGSREEAEDALQNTFLNAFRGLQRGVVPEYESAWLFKIAENVCRERRRSAWRRSRMERVDDLATTCEAVPAPQRADDSLAGLSEALTKMPESQRRAILLREWQGLSYREIAAELGLSKTAVETLIFRARRSLARNLEQPYRRRRRRLRRLDVASLLTGLKSALTGGGAAVKIAAAVVALAGAGLAAPTPIRHELRGALPFAHSARPARNSPTTAAHVPALPLALVFGRPVQPAGRSERVASDAFASLSRPGQPDAEGAGRALGAPTTNPGGVQGAGDQSQPSGAPPSRSAATAGIPSVQVPKPDPPSPPPVTTPSTPAVGLPDPTVPTIETPSVPKPPTPTVPSAPAPPNLPEAPPPPTLPDPPSTPKIPDLPALPDSTLPKLP